MMKSLKKDGAVKDASRDKNSQAAKQPVDLTARIAKRAFGLYEQRGRRDGRALEDWVQAEREIRKDEPHK